MDFLDFFLSFDFFLTTCKDAANKFPYVLNVNYWRNHSTLDFLFQWRKAENFFFVSKFVKFSDCWDFQEQILCPMFTRLDLFRSTNRNEENENIYADWILFEILIFMLMESINSSFPPLNLHDIFPCLMQLTIEQRFSLCVTFWWIPMTLSRFEVR